jgi:hypothetical protein
MSSKAVSRIPDPSKPITTGHDDFPPRAPRSLANGGGIESVQVNRTKGGGPIIFGASGAGDGSKWEHHPGKAPHNPAKFDTTDAIPGTSSNNTFPVARVGDRIELDAISAGSPDVFAGINVYVGDNSEFESFTIPEVAFVVEQADVDFVTPSNSTAKGAQATSSVNSGVSSGIVSPSSSLLAPSSVGKVDNTPPPTYAPSTSVAGDFGSYNQDNIPYDTLMLTDKTSLAEFTTKAALWGNQPNPKGPNTPYTSNNPNKGDNKYIKAQYDLTVPQILTNLANLAKNVYEPIKARYPRVIVTNTFRQGPPGAGSQQGQHGRGQAMDLVFPGLSTNQYYDVAVWIRDNLPFDQLLQEKAGSKIWIHVSYYGGTGIQVPKQNKVANLIVSPYQFVPGLAPLA